MEAIVEIYTKGMLLVDLSHIVVRKGMRKLDDSELGVDILV